MIAIENVTKIFRQEVHAVRHVTLNINKGDVFGIVGYSGAGKSTLVRCINFLEQPDEGSITIEDFGTVLARNGKLYFNDGSKEVPCTDKHLRELRKGIGMIFQHFNLLDRSTVYDNIAYSLKYTGKTKEEIQQRVNELLDLVGLADKKDAYPSELSGGQKQRVAIARALANNPKILLSDEATSALDPDATASILDLLKELNQKLGLTIVLITHEMAVIKAIANRVAVMEGGKVVEEGDVYEIFSHPKQEITKNFVHASLGLSSLNRLLEQNSPLINTTGGNKLVTLVFEKDCVGDAIISSTARECDVNINIILAEVELLQGNPLGNMAVVIEGEPENVQKAIKRFEACNVRVEEVKR